MLTNATLKAQEATGKQLLIKFNQNTTQNSHIV